MALRLAELLGLPPSFPDPASDIAGLRWTLVLLAIVWALLAARSRPLLVLLCGILFAGVAVGFWVLALGRPYGLFLDDATTRWAAQASVTAATGVGAEGVLSGEPADASPWAWLAAAGVPIKIVLLFPTLLPLVALLTVAIAVRGLWSAREHSLLAACLWLGFSTGDLDCLRGVGFLPGAWGRPEAALAFAPLAAVVLLIPRLLPHPRASLATCAALVGSWMLMPESGPPRSAADTLLLLTLDQGPWLFLGAWGMLRRRPDPSTAAFLGVGAMLVASGSLSGGSEAWGSHGFYRLGLLLAAADPVKEISTTLASRLGRHRWLRSLEPERLGLATLLLAFLPGAFVTWWDPPRLDPLARSSLEPLSTNLRAAMERTREETEAGGVFVASPEYAPYIAVLAGRRVLLAPGLFTATVDQDRRLRAERQALSGRLAGSLAERYGLRYVLVTPADVFDGRIEDPAGLTSRGALRLRFSAAGGFEVFALEFPQAPRRSDTAS